MFRPPVNRAMRVLDRSFFSKQIPLAAARVFNNSQISSLKIQLADDLLQIDRLPSVRSISYGGQVGKALLLKPLIRPNDPSTWGANIRDLASKEAIAIIPFDLVIGYDYWTYHDIMSSILPEDDQGELPTGFALVGHVAHLNLREQYLPYKHLIATVLLDKNPAVKTVINKVDDVGAQNEFRTFKYELLAGDPSLQVEIKELDCTFQFDYSKVYWNSRLNTEHERLVNLFRQGETVCDVMAGVGPFAVPAGKKRVFVCANDLNPHSYSSLVDAITRNKVSDFVRAYNEDGRAFIRASAQHLLQEEVHVDVTPKPKRGSRTAPSPGSPQPRNPVVIMSRSKTVQHYVMNLPATAITFLDAFVGLYRGHERLFVPYATATLPMIHVHCFSTKSEDNIKEENEICEEISSRIGHRISREDAEVSIWDVRDVAPKKRMFCASFRLPPEVAFRDVAEDRTKAT